MTNKMIANSRLGAHMRIIQTLLTIFLLCQVNQAVLAGDNLDSIDTARAFPVQRNNTIINSSSRKDGNVQGDAMSNASTSENKPAPKDMTLNINGNGGSTNRSAGGNATLRKRFTFD